jgi:hypothetical protein
MNLDLMKKQIDSIRCVKAKLRKYALHLLFQAGISSGTDKGVFGHG